MNIVRGMPQKGEGRARSLGFPTINIPLSDVTLSGIFAATVIYDGSSYKAVAFADPRRAILEAHIVEPFSGEVAGEVSIELHKKLRDSQMFTNDTELIDAIQRDVEEARAHFTV